MTEIAVIFVILAAIPTELTVGAQGQDVARTTIVGTVNVSRSPSQDTQTDNVRLNERVRVLESRVTSMELRLTNPRRRGHSKHSN